MKLSLNWLSDYVSVDLDPEELAHRLTMAGTEVDTIHPLGDPWDGVVIGELVSVDPHPNADRLRLATVDVGGERHTVVCGAPNLAVGDRVAFARAGARIRDGHSGALSTLKPAKIRGVESAGMVCSPRELGLSDEHEGILVLPPDAPVGIPLRRYLGDTVLDLELTRNRPDCFGVIGIAREVAALTGATVREPDASYTEIDPGVEALASVVIEDPDLCPRYCATVLVDVAVGPSPQWLQRRLQAAGQRPINNVVDVTNYVMLEYGQPLHAFDYDKLADHRIVVRRARNDHRLRTLDGVDRDLDPQMLLICDGAGPVALAGIIGGGNSEVTQTTTRVLIESANFNNLSVRRTMGRLGLRTEASNRFEKGVSPALPPIALRRATALMATLSGGRVARGMLDIYPRPLERSSIVFGTADVERILGAFFGASTIRDTLERLGFTVAETGVPGREFAVTPPYWRMDVQLAEDLVEEVARIVGYEAIPTTLLADELPAELPNPERDLRNLIRTVLVGLGAQELITYPLVSRAAIEAAGSGAPGHRIGDPIRLANPQSEDQACLRTTLRPSLLGAVAHNQRHADTDPLWLFEIGQVYLKRGEDELPEQKYILGLALAGPATTGSWTGPPRPLDFFVAKGLIETLFARLGLAGRFEPASDDAFYVAGQAARVSVGATAVGSLGRVHPDILASFDIALRDVFYCGLSVPMLVREWTGHARYRPLSRFPELLRDLAIVVGVETPAAAVERILREGTLVRDVRLFDVYRGDRIAPGKKSLAYRLRFQADDRTLSEAEVEKIQEAIVARLKRDLDAELRR